jgi:hypothetical protein
MLKSYRQPITLPAVVTNYFEPSSNNIMDFVGGNRATHQMYVAHQIRLLNTILSAVKGKADAQPQEIAAQNRALTYEDHSHLKSIVERLIKADLVDYELAEKMHNHLSDVFASLFP